jgi:hypothetical protein
MSRSPGGEPDLTIAGLRLWVHRREFPEATDYWDGNWVVVTAVCRALDTMIRVSGPILHLGELAAFLGDCEQLHSTLDGKAELDCTEPNLRVVLQVERRSHVAVTVDITPDHLAQEHRIRFDLDRTHLPSILTSCRELLVRYPIRATPPRADSPSDVPDDPRSEVCSSP